MRFLWKIVLLASLACALTGCAASGDGLTQQPTQAPSSAPAPEIPEKLAKNSQGVPILQVHVVDEGDTKEMDLETYLLGVLAGEMQSDWPMEALKAQAVLARTFVLKFASEKDSQYDNADISTDIEEAQAYNAAGIDDRIRQAVRETRGQVLSQDGELPYAWFHAHSGGTTARAKEGLNYEGEEPGYTKVTRGYESADAPEEAKTWAAAFPADAFYAALGKLGVKAASLNGLSITDRGESGRAVTIAVDGQEVNAAQLRLALGSTKMRSTLLTSLKVEDGKVSMAGKGYGHGVGMPQWGAYGLAEEGKTYKEIVLTYFDNVTVETLW